MSGLPFPQKSSESVANSIVTAKYLELLVQDQTYINGCWVKKEQTFSVYELWKAQALGAVADCDLNDIQSAIESANVAQKNLHNAEASAEMARLGYPSLIGRILYLENGKTINETKGKIAYAASFIAWLAEESNTFRKSQSVSAGIITPWNFPAAMINRKIAPALAAGCAVVFRPPSETSFTHLAFTRLASKAGFPGKAIQVCPTNRQAASRVRDMMFNLRCSGQTCVVIHRLYVQRGFLDEFTRRQVQKVSELGLGPGIEDLCTEGPLINVSVVDKVKSHLFFLHLLFLQTYTDRHQ
ncbi:uncharacterized protein N7446_008132 [Penicillium canescens]|uniref:Aldehyde dehydrogenase domain-containing protein n=1 Tax=Penicillium canescens TaxID=5083 RepID=A0AAD6IMT7_PENCN|nr:uncharacterized protein N7446_008132 [Penicillium canescens]KAJ6033577.1 hypothetical protein N7444_011348 [Penicillium canescens]KAJ6057233.1 hypothetical protein N7460_000507 [Penicillium canescens]KAJ6058549.1 hypothetical protein N7446_008132 [Penicillium canescens]